MTDKFRTWARALRVEQWTKNGVVMLAWFFSVADASQREIARGWESFLMAVAMAGAFSLVSSAFYLLNDVSDFEADKLHPVKRFRPIAAGLIQRMTAVRVALVRHRLELDDFEDFLVLPLPNFKKVENIIDEISEILSQNETDKNIICSSLLYSLLIKLSDAKKRSATGILSRTQERIKPVIAYMEENYTKDIPLKVLSEIIEVSPNFLCRLFKEAYSTSPIKYLISIRLQKAKFFLSESNSILIKDVAEKVGFRDVSYFCSVFKKNEGISPADFQKAHSINK